MGRITYTQESECVLDVREREGERGNLIALVYQIAFDFPGVRGIALSTL